MHSLQLKVVFSQSFIFERSRKMTTKAMANIITSTSVPKLDSYFVDCLSDSSMADIFGVLNTPDFSVFPGFCDVHVHFREPGFSYKETVETGSRAAARGGYTAVCTMANLSPVPDSVENLAVQLRLIEDQACIHVYPLRCHHRGREGRDLSRPCGHGKGRGGLFG